VVLEMINVTSSRTLVALSGGAAAFALSVAAASSTMGLAGLLVLLVPVAMIAYSATLVTGSQDRRLAVALQGTNASLQRSVVTSLGGLVGAGRSADASAEIAYAAWARGWMSSQARDEAGETAREPAAV
jgi:hypothetical protein